MFSISMSVQEPLQTQQTGKHINSDNNAELPIPK